MDMNKIDLMISNGASAQEIAIAAYQAGVEDAINNAKQRAVKMSTVDTKVTHQPHKFAPVWLRATGTKELDKVREELLSE